MLGALFLFMDITLILSDAEVEALESERIDIKEPVEVIIRRQFAPLVDRLLTQKLRDLQTFYDALPVDQKIKAIADLETLAAATRSAMTVRPIS